MAVTKEFKLFDPEDLKIVYNRLNGKGNSFVHTREISLKNIMDALSDSFHTNKPKIIQRFQEIDDELSFSNEEIYWIRSKIVDSIQKKFSIKLNFEEIPITWGQWSRVKISNDSEYYRQCKEEGTLQNSFDKDNNDDYVRVIFDNGYKNVYRKRDLIAIKRKNNKEDEQALANATKETNDVFLERICGEIFNHIKGDTNILRQHFPEIMGFRSGDDIIMNEKANNHYYHTQKGSRGKVIVASHDSIIVKFSYLSGGGDLSEQYLISQEFADLKNPKILQDNDKKEIYDKIDAMIKSISQKTTAYMISSKRQEKYEKQFVSMGTEKLIKDGMFIPIDEKNYALNFGEVTKFVAPNLHAIYTNPELFSSPVMFEPPAERQPNVLRLQLTDGCNHNRCTYCNGFNGVKHKQKTKKEFIKHTNKVVESLGGYRKDIDRIFIGSGNGLDVDQRTLKKCIEYVDDTLHPRRIAIYATTKSIIKKTLSELIELEDHGLSCIYRGAETGSDAVLDYINKGCSSQEMLIAGHRINSAQIPLSVMLMPGLGGKRYAQEHVKGIINLLNSIDSKFITLMTINPTQGSKYERIMNKEIELGTNRPLTNVEIVEQVKEIVKNLKPRGQKIGMFGKEIDIVGSNPINFSITLYDDDEKRELIKICDKYIKNNKDKGCTDTINPSSETITYE